MTKHPVLVIDDEAGLAWLVKLNLELTGEFQVETANSGADGVKRAVENDFDLVITDYRMPGMDGRAVARAIKAAKPNCPVLLCTGDLELASGQQPAEVAGVISKPVDHKRLYAIITQTIAKSAV